MVKDSITDQQLNDEIELMLSRIDYASKNFQEIKRMIDNQQVPGVMKLIYMSQCSEMCHQIMVSLGRIAVDNGCKNESQLLLTAIESLDEVRQIIDVNNLKHRSDIGSTIKDKIFRVATISEILK